MFHSREIVVNQPDGSGPGSRNNGRGPSPLLAGEPVAYAVDRLYVLARGLDLRPQAPDVDVHRLAGEHDLVRVHVDDQVGLAGKPLALTYKEYELLKMMAATPGRAYTR